MSTKVPDFTEQLEQLEQQQQGNVPEIKPPQKPKSTNMTLSPAEANSKTEQQQEAQRLLEVADKLHAKLDDNTKSTLAAVAQGIKVANRQILSAIDEGKSKVTDAAAQESFAKDASMIKTATEAGFVLKPDMTTFGWNPPPTNMTSQDKLKELESGRTDSDKGWTRT